MTNIVNLKNVVPLNFTDSSNEQSTFWRKVDRYIGFHQLFADHKKKHDAISAQLTGRNEKVLELWDTYPPEKKALAFKIATILKENLDWPNNYFIPTDPFGMILHDKYGDLPVEESVIEIENLIGKKIDDSIWQSFEKTNYSEVIDYLYSVKKA